MTSTIHTNSQPSPPIDVLRRELEEARAELAAAKQALEDFKVRASDVLGQAASDRDLCEAYDEVAEAAGLYRRVSDQDVEIEVTYRQTITVRSRTWMDAREEVKGLTVSRYFSPGSPFSEGIEASSSPWSVGISVPDEIF